MLHDDSLSGTFFFDRSAKPDLFPIMAGAPPVCNDLNFSHLSDASQENWPQVAVHHCLSSLFAMAHR